MAGSEQGQIEDCLSPTLAPVLPSDGELQLRSFHPNPRVLKVWRYVWRCEPRFFFFGGMEVANHLCKELA